MKHQWRSAIGSGLLLVCALLAAPARAIEGGIPARSGDRLARATVAIGTLVDRGEAYGIGRCSGALIAPNLVLTAAHCVRGDPLAAIALFFDGSSPIPSPQPVAAFARFDVPLEELPGGVVGRLAELSLDIAVLRLADPIASRRPVPVVRSLENPPKKLRLAGAGLSGRRAGILKTTTLDVLHVSPTGLTLARASNALVCQGDSGGPAVVDGRGGPVVWGVASAVITSTPPCGRLVIIAPAAPALGG